MTEEDILELDIEMIVTLEGAQYERRGSNLYSLNYAEPGMLGSSLGKLIPPDLAKAILAKHRRWEEITRGKGSRQKTVISKPKEERIKPSQQASQGETSKAERGKEEGATKKPKSTTGVRLFKIED
jgi:hypothetical protein